MRFLIVTKPMTPPPPEMVVPMIEAMEAWLAKGRAEGHLREVWSFAGTQGGGGISEVETFEQLDEIMAEFPFGPFSSVEVYPLSDLGRSLAAGKAVYEQMTGMLAATR